MSQNENVQRYKIDQDKMYALEGKTILAIANMLKDELPARFAAQAFKAENLLATARLIELSDPQTDLPEEDVEQPAVTN